MKEEDLKKQLPKRTIPLLDELLRLNYEVDQGFVSGEEYENARLEFLRHFVNSRKMLRAKYERSLGEKSRLSRGLY